VLNLRSRSWLLFGALFSSVLLAAAGAGAAPIGYSVSTGHVDISVFFGGAPVGSTPNVALTGTITLDAVAMTVDALSLDLAANTPISLTQAVWGYTTINVESANLTTGPGYQVYASSGNSSLFNVSVGPLAVNGSWGADANGSNPAVSGQPISFSILSAAFVANTTPLVEAAHVTLNFVDGADFGHPGEHLTIVGHYVISTGTVLVPEPGTGLLVALGLVGLVWRQRSGTSARTASRE